MTSYTELFEYYTDQETLPTHGKFKSPADLQAYEYQRRLLFTEKLQLPPQMFAGRPLIEFGPDVGENSLVFSRWGSQLTLVEPNQKAHPVIRGYFDHYKSSSSLIELIKTDIREFDSGGAGKKYDFVDAEGFIYTVRPASMWMKLFSRILEPGGFLILFHYEYFSGLFELLLKVVHSRTRSLSGEPSTEVARRVFDTKWSSIPHKRSIDSWIMDVLENPFVRLEYFLEAKQLCQEFDDHGFSLYSSWPPYRDGTDVYWYKRMPSSREILDSVGGFLSRSRLSHAFGRRLFMAREAEMVEDILSNMLKLTDSQIDSYDLGRSQEMREQLERLRQVTRSSHLVATDEDISVASRLVEGFLHLLEVLDRADLDEIVRFCNSNRSFIEAWGMPSHFVVFRKRYAEEQ